MTLRHHPDDATLMSYASGALPSAHAAVVSTHLMSCEKCRQAVREMELIGSALFGDLPATPMQQPKPDFATIGALDTAQSPALDDPITQLTGHSLEDIPWKRLGWGVWHYPIKSPSVRAGDLRLLKVQSGQSMPEHGHGGNELTVVLQGSYTDEIGRFSAGDVADLDDSIEHRPVADPETGCICLIASETPAKFKGVIGRLIQPLAGM